MRELLPEVLCPHKFEDVYVLNETSSGSDSELFQECPYCGAENVEEL